MRPLQALWSVAIAALAISGCGHEPPAGPANDRNMPVGTMQLVAHASSIDAQGMHVDCEIDGAITIAGPPNRTPTATVYVGTGGGHAHRQRLDETGAGVSFFASYHQANVEVRLLAGDSIEIRDVTKYSDKGASRFWDAMTLFAGNMRTSGAQLDILASGSWTCLPMDTPASSGGYHDVTGEAVGTWELKVSR